MTGRVQTLRSSTAGNRPTGQQPGSLYVNFPDLQLGVVNASSAAQDLIGVRFFSTTTSYVVGNYVIQGGLLYRAIAAVSPGAFNAAQWAVADASSLTPNPNRIDNGDMWVDQHCCGTSVAAPGSDAVFCPDRFMAFNSVATSRFNVGQNYPAAITTKPPGFQYFLGVQSTSAYTPVAAAQLVIQHGIEAYAVSDLGFGAAGAQSVTVSFWARSSLTGNFSFALFSPNTVTTGVYRVYVTTYSLPTANTWTKIVITIPGDTTNPAAWPLVGLGPGLYLGFDLGSGSSIQTSTLNAWQTTAAFVATSGVKLCATNGANWAITGLKLEAGSVATAFPVEDLARKLARCQRYFNKTYNMAEIPGSGSRIGSSLEVFTGPTAMPATTAYCSLIWAYPVPMMVAPTITLYSPNSGAVGKAYAQNANADLTAAVQSGEKASTLLLSGAVANATDFILFHATASAEI
jgi:hypothetical protein